MRWVLSFVTLCAMFIAGMLAPESARERPIASEPVTGSVLPDPPGSQPPRADSRAYGGRIAEATRQVRYESEISDREAIQIALARGEELTASRAGNKAPDLRREEAEVVARAVVVTQDAITTASEPVEATVAPEPASPLAEAADSVTTTEPAAPTETAIEGPVTQTWRVTAERVNLRGGPGTEHPIVGGVDEGDVLIPVSGLGTEWVEIERPEGNTAWIFSQFIAASEG